MYLLTTKCWELAHRTKSNVLAEVLKDLLAMTMGRKPGRGQPVLASAGVTELQSKRGRGVSFQYQHFVRFEARLDYFLINLSAIGGRFPWSQPRIFLVNSARRTTCLDNGCPAIKDVTLVGSQARPTGARCSTPREPPKEDR